MSRLTVNIGELKEFFTDDPKISAELREPMSPERMAELAVLVEGQRRDR